MSKSSVIVLAVVACVVLSLVVGCESDAQKGTAVGALAGAGVGQLAGRDTKSTLIGAGVGAGAGYLLGKQSDKSKAKKEAETQKAIEEASTISVNITNSNGSVSTIKLKKQGTGFVGPRGEFYQTLPSEEHLKQVYGF